MMEATVEKRVVPDAPRQLAFRILAAAVKSGRVNDHLHRALTGSNLEPQARNFITELVLGSTRMRGLLDAQLTACYNGRYTHLEDGVVICLRMGAYQIRFMDSVPDRAAVHSTVDLARAVKLGRAAGLVNAVLRKFASTPPRLVEPDETSSIDDLAAHFSHPKWLIQKWYDQWPPSQVISLMRWNNERPTVWLRHKADAWSESRLQQILEAGHLEPSAHPQVSGYMTVAPSSAALFEPDILAEGLFIAQDPSAGAVVAAVDARPGDTVIDLCAGPGGKTVGLAEAVGPEGRVHAYEIDPDRLSMINETLVRMGINNVDLHPGDATDHKLPRAKTILIDAPCTGTGVMARRADLRWKREPGHLVELNMIQKTLLDHAAGFAGEGTEIVYATCSLEPEENWGVVEAFLQRHPELKTKTLPKTVPSQWIDETGALATFPPRDGVDGIFAVRLGR